MRLKKNEKLIKKGMVRYRGSPATIYGSAYGSLYLTNQRLVLEYYCLGIPTSKKVYGISKRKIEIPLNKIRKVVKGWITADIIRIVYQDDKNKTKHLFFNPWKAWTFALEIIKIGKEWINKINKVIK